MGMTHWLALSTPRELFSYIELPECFECSASGRKRLHSVGIECIRSGWTTSVALKHSPHEGVPRGIQLCWDFG
jgi:hypothetical protein